MTSFSTLRVKLYTSVATVFCFACVLVGSVSAQEKTPAGLYNEGLALLKQKDYSGGLALMEEALSIAGPDDEKVVTLAKKNGAIAAYNAANSMRKEGNFDGALELYNKGIEYNPTNSANYEGVARAQEGKGEKMEAIKSYLVAAAKGSEEGKEKRASSCEKKAKTMVGKLFVTKKYEDAIAAGESFVSVKDDNAEVHYYLSRSFAETGNSEKALAHADKAISLAGEASEDKYYYAQATQLEKLGRKADAIASYKKITGEKYKKQADYKISQLGG